jgi:ketosteroid isomerase-like protein
MRAWLGALVVVSFPAVAVTSVLAGECGAQVLPGGRRSSVGDMRSGHSRYARAEVDATLARLEEAVAAGRSDRVAKQYAVDATLLTGFGTLLQGRGAVLDRYARALPRMRDLRITVHAFDVSGGLAHVLATLRYDVTLSSGGSQHVEVPVSFALREERFGWLIQSQAGGELPSVVSPNEHVPARAEMGDSLTVGVRVMDASGLGTPNVLVVFESEVGGAVIHPTAVRTDAAGVAVASVRLGVEPGLTVVRATATGVIGEPVFFSIRTGERVAP